MSKDNGQIMNQTEKHLADLRKQRRKIGERVAHFQRKQSAEWRSLKEAQRHLKRQDKRYRAAYRKMLLWADRAVGIDRAIENLKGRG